MKRLLLSLLLVLVAATTGVAQTQDISGDWQGTLSAPGAELHLLLHIEKGDGGLKATLDSVDQGAYAIPITTISVQDSNLTFDVASVHGSYQGKVNDNASTITGTWSQGQTLPLEWKRVPAKLAAEQPSKPVQPSDIDGTWMGTLDTGAFQLHIVFHIVTTADGLHADLESPDQSPGKLAASSVTRQASSLKIEVQRIGGVFEGKIAPDSKSIDGTWSQNGGSFPLLLKPVSGLAQLERRRPQNPMKPYPYREEEVSYDNKTQNVTLAGTLTLPQGKGPFPAVLLIPGSGAHDRDESLMGHKPFLVLSDYLTRQGIAVLRADDRGVGESTGSMASVTSADLATDAEAGIAYLKTRREVDAHKIGLVGHSEGGLIAPMIAARNPDVAFIVMMAGPGIPGDEVLVGQSEKMAEAAGQSHDDVEKAGAKQREILTLVKSGGDDATLAKQLRPKLEGDIPQNHLAMQIKMILSPWFRYFIAYDPSPVLRKVKCPVLAVIGEKDWQVPPQQNLPAIRKALEAGGNRHFAVEELPGLNHLFQTAKTGAPSEYAQIEETISPVALGKIGGWILKQ
jgi:pimeloyl-ACP methyl ester carboxylesterase